MRNGGRPDESVEDRAPRDAELREPPKERCGIVRTEKARRRKARVQKPPDRGRCPSHRWRQPRQHGVRLERRVTGQPEPTTTDGPPCQPMMLVVDDDEGYRNAGVDEGVWRA